MTKEEAMRLLAKTKVYVGEMREEVISKLLVLGFDVIGRDNINGLLDPEFLYINSCNFTGGKWIDAFFSHSYKQISMSEILDIQIDEEFKDGDVLSSKSGSVFIFNGEYDDDGDLIFYIGLGNTGQLVLHNTSSFLKSSARFATKEESAKLFKALSDAGKRWNEEKKRVEDLSKEFKPFDKVLMKCADGFGLPWVCCFYSHKEGDLHCSCGGTSYPECIPYEGNESLLGTSLPY